MDIMDSTILIIYLYTFYMYSDLEGCAEGN